MKPAVIHSQVPMMMGSLQGKRLSTYYRSRMWYRVDRGRCVLIGRGGVLCKLEMISQLTMFGQCNRMDSMSHHSRISLVNSPTNPCIPPGAAGNTLEHTM